MADDLVAYVSDQTHSSFARAARNLGFRHDQVRVLPVDDSYRLRTDLLASAMDADLAAGRRPLFVCANGGATNTGAVDPLPAIAAICRERGAWFHVDAAYGGFAVLADAGRAQLEGLALADSITLDPHKWLYQPYECGCLLVRAGPALGRRLRDHPGLPERRGRASRRDQLLRPRHAAEPLVAGAQDLGLDPLLRPRRVSAGDRALARARRARDGADRAERGARACWRRRRSASSASGGASAASPTGRRSTRETASSCRHSRRAASGSSRRRDSTAGTRSGCAS